MQPGSGRARTNPGSSSWLPDTVPQPLPWAQASTPSSERPAPVVGPCPPPPGPGGDGCAPLLSACLATAGVAAIAVLPRPEALASGLNEGPPFVRLHFPRSHRLTSHPLHRVSFPLLGLASCMLAVPVTSHLSPGPGPRRFQYMFVELTFCPCSPQGFKGLLTG